MLDVNNFHTPGRPPSMHGKLRHAPRATRHGVSGQRCKKQGRQGPRDDISGEALRARA